MLSALKPLLPFVTIFAGVILGYRYILDCKLDEKSATIILPLIMLGCLLYDRLIKRMDSTEDGETRFRFRKAVVDALLRRHSISALC